MKPEQFINGLIQTFNLKPHEQRKIVFWYDAEQSFTDSLDDIAQVMPELKIVNMQGQSALGTKILLERDDPLNNYLLYFSYVEPNPELDWLLDIKLYSQVFYADRFSILLKEFDLERASLREHLANRAVFLGSKERINTLKRYLQPTFDETQLDMAMIASVVRAETSEISDIVLALANKFASQNEGLMQPLKEVNELKKYGLLPTLVARIEQWLDIRSLLPATETESEFDIGKLFIQLLVTELFNHLPEQKWATAHILPSASGQAISRSFLTRWRDSQTYSKSYIKISEWVSDLLKIDEKLHQLSVAKLLNVDTFEVIDRLIISDLVQQIPTTTATQLQELQQVVNTRLATFWVKVPVFNSTIYDYEATYHALTSAIGLFELRQRFDNGFNFDSLVKFYQAYTEDIYQFDLYYRHYFALQLTLGTKLNLIQPLNEAMENCYSYWYLDTLAQSWDKKIEQEQRLENWYLDNVINQQHFYSHWVEPLLQSSQNRRIVVIISDALRYEAGVELAERINQKRYSKATITSQLGVLPSYTALGKACLLPHQTFEYKPDADKLKNDVYVDGISSASTENRSRILANHNGKAFGFEEVNTFSKEAGREAFKPYDLVYIYHDEIDAIGDKQPTEHKTLNAVETTIEQLTQLSQKILSDFNVSTVFITSDHGFLFQQSMLQETDRTRLNISLDNYPIIKNKKRYVIAHDLPANNSVWHGSTERTAGTTNPTQFWIPRGNQRFHFVGGARFTHGGAMPQEIVVPVIIINRLRGEKALQRTKTPVEINLVRSNVKFSDYVQSIDFLQIEPVSEFFIPSMVSIGVYDEDKLVSSEEIITFDSTSQDYNERIKTVKIALSGTFFDRKKTYHLIVKDKVKNIELNKFSVMVDVR